MKIEKEHRKSTLMSWTKEQLVERIMCLEHNNNVFNERLDQQAKNFKTLLTEKEELEEQCRVIRQPTIRHRNLLRPGTIVYRLGKSGANIHTDEISGILSVDYATCYSCKLCISQEDIGKTVFLSHEEAEEVLKCRCQERSNI